MMTRSSLRTAAKELAQDNGADNGNGVKLLLNDPDDYNQAIAMALRQFDSDVENRIVTDYTVATSGFRFALLGGANNILPNNPATPAAPAVALVALAGNVNAGTHAWKITIVTSDGETAGSVASAILTTDGGHGQVTVTMPTANIPSNATGWNVYRTIVGNTGPFKLVGFQAKASGANFTDNVADASLGVMAPVESTAVSLSAWVDAKSRILTLWWPYADANQGTVENDTNTYRTRRAPSGTTFLEFAGDTPAVSDIIRLEYTGPRVISEGDPSKTSVREGEETALTVLTASLLLQLAANKAAQNTGNSGLPNDVVDRRNQSDVFRSRSKELRETYNNLVGITTGEGGGSDVKPYAVYTDLDVQPSHPWGFLWHPPSTH